MDGDLYRTARLLADLVRDDRDDAIHDVAVELARMVAAPNVRWLCQCMTDALDAEGL